MALINRMSRLFTADVHAVLDRIEEPEILLRQAIREMEEALAQSEQRVANFEREVAAVAERQHKIDTLLVELGQQLDVSFAAGNEDLARRVIKRKLETERLAAHVAERRSVCGKALADGRRKLDEQGEHLDVMRQKAELLSASARSGAVTDDWRKPEFVVGDDEVEVAYLREQQRRAKS
jgi:phage shock protein A